MALLEKVCSRVSLLRNTLKLLSISTAQKAADKNLSTVVRCSVSYPSRITNIRSKPFSDSCRTELARNELLNASVGAVVLHRCKHTGPKDKNKSIHRKDSATISEGEQKYVPQSPYRENWPSRYGYFSNYYKGGKQNICIWFL